MAEEALRVLSGASIALVRMFAGALTLLALLVALAPAEAAAPVKSPVWAELPVEQQQILAPLKADWDKMDRQPRVKWVGIAKRYPTMTAREQRRIQTRMERWAKLTPAQREVARNNYRNHVGALPPEKKKELQAQWFEYRALPEDERRRLAEKAAQQKPAVTPKRTKKAPPDGAATAPR